MNYNYDEILTYVCNNLLEIREIVDGALSSMSRYRLPINQAHGGRKVEDAIYNAISDYAFDNDIDDDDLMEYIFDDKDVEDVMYDALDRLDN